MKISERLDRLEFRWFLWRMNAGMNILRLRVRYIKCKLAIKRYITGE